MKKEKAIKLVSAFRTATLETIRAQGDAKGSALAKEFQAAMALVVQLTKGTVIEGANNSSRKGKSREYLVKALFLELTKDLT
jgi:hypothetical protein